MKVIKKSTRPYPKVSLILIDWSVRESFHLLHYLNKQDIDRNLFETVIIEYYSQVSDAILKFEDEVDSLVLLEMPEDCYYHKHLMYNAGIVSSRGDICVICDSDAMVEPSFIRSIMVGMDTHPNTVLHIDQFRNTRKDLYPFCYPDFTEVTGEGCINNENGKPRGIVDDKDAIHNRNYGACMCAWRQDLIRIGGSDEHIDYLGHICGPYEMTFRLLNSGCREMWHQTEFTYHTWHPGQAGVDNYLGPHDGRHVSTTAIDALVIGRSAPLVENLTFKNFKLGKVPSLKIETFQCNNQYKQNWKKNRLLNGKTWVEGNSSRKFAYGLIVDKFEDGFIAYPRFIEHPEFVEYQDKFKIFANNELELYKVLDNLMPFKIRLLLPLIILLTYASKAFSIIFLYLKRRLVRFTKKIRT